jgi:hypothetical protein
VEAIGMRGRKLGQQLAELFPEGKVRLDLFVGLRVEVRQIDGVADFAREQVSGDDFGDFNAAFLLRFVSAGAQVGRQGNGSGSIA